MDNWRKSIGTYIYLEIDLKKWKWKISIVYEIKVLHDKKYTSKVYYI